MTQEEKKLLLIDLSARLPYGVIGQIELEVTTNAIDYEGYHVTITDGFKVKLTSISDDGIIQISPIGNFDTCDFVNQEINCSKEYGEELTIEDFKPYLRPMSSMTEKEKKKYDSILKQNMFGANVQYAENIIGWLRSKHFNINLTDGLYIEVNENNNPYK